VNLNEQVVKAEVDCVMMNIPVEDRKLQQIKLETEKDEVLCKLRDVILAGWPENRNQCPNMFVPYWNYRDELTVMNDVIMKGMRVVIPQSLRKERQNSCRATWVSKRTKREQELCPLAVN
jgi:hypothetical protein